MRLMDKLLASLKINEYDFMMAREIDFYEKENGEHYSVYKFPSYNKEYNEPNVTESIRILSESRYKRVV